MNSNHKIEFSILMPCLNEAETVGICINKARESLDSHKIPGEVIIADNGSTDGSQSIAAQLGARVVHVQSKGYGNALMGGIKEAMGDFVIISDCDDSYDLTNIGPFIEKLRQGYDFVFGNRFKGGIRSGAMSPLHRYLGNPMLTGIGKTLFQCTVGDFHCGFRGFRKDSMMKLDMKSSGMEFSTEMIVKATLHRMRITEVPTVLYPDGRRGRSHLNTFRDGWRHLRLMLLHRLEYWSE